jgi:hypothetical protein
MDKNKFCLGGRLFSTASQRLGVPMQHKACPQVGHRNAMQGTSASSAPQCTSATKTQLTSITQGTSVRPQLGRCNATQATSASWVAKRNEGEFARWAPKQKTHPQRKHPHKGALGKKTRWRMDKNKFWLGGRLFNTASPRLGAPMQRKVRPQGGRPNANQGASARWAPKRKTDPQRKCPHKRALG